MTRDLLETAESCGRPANKPLTVSAVLLCYNAERYVREALRSVLEQDFQGSMEVIVSDDASTDGTVDVIRRELAANRGPHSARLLVRPANSGGKTAHLNQVFPNVRGDVLVSFDADDIAEPHRIATIARQFGADRSVHAVFSGCSLIDAIGRPKGLGGVPHPSSNTDTRSWFAQVDAYAAGATLAIRREVMELFGTLPHDISEDITLPFRASLIGEVSYVPEPLVRYRRHAASMTADSERYESLDAYRDRARIGIARARRHLEGRLEDLEKAAALGLFRGRTSEPSRLESIARDSLAQAEMTGLLSSAKPTERLSALLRVLRAGAYPEERTQQFGLTFVPSLYLWYKRRRWQRLAGEDEDWQEET
jgi:glycosyltransferase involved in cell wall biosynthesis